jgi:GAF domain-containing protein
MERIPLGESGDTDLVTVLGELEVAHEELRVAEEEIAAQRAQVDALLTRHAAEQGWRERLTDLLSVGMLVTTLEGAVIEANSTACALLGVRPVNLPHKPLQVFVEPDSRPVVRDACSSIARGSGEQRIRVVLAPRRSETYSAELVGIPDVGENRRIRWIVVPDDVPVQIARASAGLATSGVLAHDVEDELTLAASFASLCLLPLDTDDRRRLISRIASVAGTALPAATAVSLTIGSPTEPEELASNSAMAQRLDGLQMRTAEGPCVDAYDKPAVVVTGDVAADSRWPRLARVVPAREVRSVMALPVQLHNRRIGVLNVYAATVDAFTDRSVRVGELLAVAVGAVLEAAEERRSMRALSENLERALQSRAVIEQAKGIVMAHVGGTADDAFARLVALSSRRNVKLRDLAARVVSSRSAQVLSDL